jgi:3-deoxy-D-manno-octulosonate 8-phosphate phosphatase (KDO 8-P phosphatase)
MADKAIRIVASDVDGTLTDGAMYYSSSGETGKVFSVKDGVAVRLLAACGIETVLISSDDSPVIKGRAERLGISRCYSGISDKVGVIDALCAESDIGLDEIAYLGDDLQDYEVMRRVGLPSAVGDAHPLVKDIATYVCVLPGGKGAFREFSEWIIERSGQTVEQVWKSLVAKGK